MQDKYFETRFTYSEKREKVWRALCEYLQRFIPSNSKILDLGAGYCEFINNIQGEEKWALDINEECLKFAASDVKTFVGSCVSLSVFEDDLFHVVFASNLLEHLTSEELEMSIKEVRRLLRHGGRFIVISPNFRYAYKEYFDDYTHKTVLSHVGLCDMLRAYDFKIEKCIPKFLPFSVKSKLPASPVLVKLYLRLPFKPFAKQMLIVALKR